MTVEVIHLVARLAVALVLLLAVIGKVRDVQSAREGVSAYGILPERLVTISTAGLLVLETGAGISLLLEVAPAWGALTATGLFSTFSGAIAVNLARGSRIPCGCFGGDTAERISPYTLGRALILLLFSGGVLWWSLQDVDSPQRSLILPSVTLAVGAVIVLRVMGLIPVAISFFRIKAVLGPVPTHRVSFRNMPLDSPLNIQPPVENQSTVAFPTEEGADE